MKRALVYSINNLLNLGGDKIFQENTEEIKMKTAANFFAQKHFDKYPIAILSSI